MQPGSGSHVRAAERRIGTDVRNPDRLPGFPDAADEPFAAWKCPTSAVLDELGGLHVRRVPQVDEPEPLALLLHSPRTCRAPSRDSRRRRGARLHRVFDGCRLGQDPGHGVFRGQTPPGPRGLSQRFARVVDHPHVPAAHIRQRQHVRGESNEMPHPPRTVPGCGKQEHHFGQSEKQSQRREQLMFRPAGPAGLEPKPRRTGEE